MYAKNAWLKYDEKSFKDVMDFNEGYKDYITKGKTERLCVKETEKIALANGFKKLDEYDTLQKGDKVLTHIQICELNGELLADIEDYFAIGSSDLPIAINRSLRQMGLGEEMRIIAPWYTAYGAEGTSLIKPYSNLIITLTTIEE